MNRDRAVLNHPFLKKLTKKTFHRYEENSLKDDYMYTPLKESKNSGLLKLLHVWILYLGKKRLIQEILESTIWNIKQELCKIWLPILPHSSFTMLREGFQSSHCLQGLGSKKASHKSSLGLFAQKRAPISTADSILLCIMLLQYKGVQKPDCKGFKMHSTCVSSKQAPCFQRSNYSSHLVCRH